MDASISGFYRQYNVILFPLYLPFPAFLGKMALLSIDVVLCFIPSYIPIQRLRGEGGWSLRLEEVVPGDKKSSQH